MMKCLLCNATLAFDFSWRWFLASKLLKLYRSAKSAIKSLLRSLRKRVVRAVGVNKPSANCAKIVFAGAICKRIIVQQGLYVYAEPNMRAYFEAYKFQGDYRLRQIFAKTLQAYCKKYLRRGWSIVVIPVDEQTLATRGFDQVVGFLPDIPKKMYLYHLKKFGRCPQSHKSRQERLATPQPFGYQGPADLERKNILLVDDIYTTGSTLYHARELLLAHNCGCVRSVTLAR